MTPHRVTNKSWSHSINLILSHDYRLVVIKEFGPTQLLEKQSNTFARDRQRVVQRRLDELSVTCSQAKQLL